MRKMPIQNILPGMKTACPVVTDGDSMLIGAGYVLTPKNIERLVDMKLNWVMVDDPLTAGIEPTEPLRDSVRRDLQKKMTKLVDEVRKATPRPPESTWSDYCAQFRGQPLPAIAIELAEYIALTAQREIEQDSKKVIAYMPAASEELYLVDHALDVMCLSIMLAQAAGLTGKEIGELALGALLHDVALFFLPVPEKHDGASEGEFYDTGALKEEHTTVGYDILRKTPRVGILSTIVAYQHHEYQDGRGFPQGITGSNKILRGKELMQSKGIIHPYAEICALVDTFVTLTSDSRNRIPLPFDKGLDMIMRLAGTRLNMELVRLFLGHAPRYPLGSEVIVQNGHYSGSRAIVAQISHYALNRPIVKLLEDESQTRYVQEITIDLEANPSVLVRGV
ncbi:HD-GYP domain-containing protein [Chrysiogenes arsenatis]|uniref:HD-GYP domain-containing protein n=1 Tax=Chrysiogenes arsenatis TaxID=309797 RepID=UPI0003FD9D0D|nr:HD domain-containing phosphohydrolase [Chrysiogenes arsenatis]